MKKIYSILAFTLLLISGCSSDSNSNSSNLLLKEIQMTTTSSDGFTSSITFTYTYNGNKISMIKVDDYWESHYTYSGNLITSVSIYDHGDLLNMIDYVYDSQERLIKATATEFQEGYSDLFTYTYNTDSTVTRLTYDGTTENPANLYQTSKITLDSESRFVKLEDFDGSNWVPKIQATYTANNSALRNITGYDKLMLTAETKNSFATYDQLNNSATGFNYSSGFEYTLNSSNYPTHRVQTVNNNDGTTSVSTSNLIYY